MSNKKHQMHRLAVLGAFAAGIFSGWHLFNHNSELNGEDRSNEPKTPFINNHSSIQIDLKQPNRVAAPQMETYIYVNYDSAEAPVRQIVENYGLISREIPLFLSAGVETEVGTMLFEKFVDKLAKRCVFSRISESKGVWILPRTVVIEQLELFGQSFKSALPATAGGDCFLKQIRHDLLRLSDKKLNVSIEYTQLQSSRIWYDSDSQIPPKICLQFEGADKVFECSERKLERSILRDFWKPLVGKKKP